MKKLIFVIIFLSLAGCAGHTPHFENNSTQATRNIRVDSVLDSSRPKLTTHAELVAHIKGRADGVRGIWSTRGLHTVGEYDAYVWAHNYELWRKGEITPK